MNKLDQRNKRTRHDRGFGKDGVSDRQICGTREHMTWSRSRGRTRGKREMLGQWKKNMIHSRSFSNS